MAPAHYGAVLEAEAVPHPAESSAQAATTRGDAGVFVSLWLSLWLWLCWLCVTSKCATVVVPPGCTEKVA